MRPKYSFLIITVPENCDKAQLVDSVCSKLRRGGISGNKIKEFQDSVAGLTFEATLEIVQQWGYVT